MAVDCATGHEGARCSAADLTAVIARTAANGLYPVQGKGRPYRRAVLTRGAPDAAAGIR